MAETLILSILAGSDDIDFLPWVLHPEEGPGIVQGLIEVVSVDLNPLVNPADPIMNIPTH